jgi:natural product biosynthesis luciferase-like monooxygenase protein
MQFSMMFFASDDGAAAQQACYDLLLDCAAFGDTHGFTALWLPERHFHRFGGPFPNPAVLGAALAVRTERLRIRAGSVICPLHDPLRIAEEWSMVDNLSRGRVDLAFGQGWNPTDFVLAPQHYEQRLQVMRRHMEQVATLWSGATIERVNGMQQSVPVRIYPTPVQPALETWLTCSGGADRFAEAGASGANVLTALLFQDPAEMAAKIAAYRTARQAAGFAGPGRVTLMLHTFVGAEVSQVRQQVRAPMLRYLDDSIDLWRQQSHALDALDPDEQSQVMEFALQRYLRRQSLCGSVDSCLPLVRELQRIGVDEIACLLDFGLTPDQVRGGLPFLAALQQAASVQQAEAACSN